MCSSVDHFARDCPVEAAERQKERDADEKPVVVPDVDTSAGALLPPSAAVAAGEAVTITATATTKSTATAKTAATVKPKRVSAGAPAAPAAAAAAVVLKSGDDLGDEWDDLMPFYIAPNGKNKKRGVKGDDDAPAPAAPKQQPKKQRREVVF